MSVITNLLASKNYISTNKVLARAIGLNESILFAELCSKHNFYQESSSLDSEGFFYMTAKDIEFETTLTARQQAPVIEHLEQLNFITTKLKGVPAKKHFAITKENEISFVSQFNDYLSSFNKKDKQVSTKREIKFRQNVETEIDKMSKLDSTFCLLNNNKDNNKDKLNYKSSPSPTVEAKTENEFDLKTEPNQDTPFRRAEPTSFEKQTNLPSTKVEKRAGDRTKHLHQWCVDFYDGFHKTKVSGEAFLWNAKHLKAIKDLRVALEKKTFEKYGESMTDEHFEASFAFFVEKAYEKGDNFLKNNFSPSLIHSKFNEIITIIKNGKESTSYNNGNKYGVKYTSEIDRLIATATH